MNKKEAKELAERLSGVRVMGVISKDRKVIGVKSQKTMKRLLEQVNWGDVVVWFGVPNQNFFVAVDISEDEIRAILKEVKNG